MTERAALDTPEAVAAEYFERIDDRAWRSAVDLVAPICIERFMRYEAKNRPPKRESLEEYLERDTSQPREVMEYFYQQAQSQPWPTLSDYFAGVETEEELNALDDRELYARHVQATDSNERYRLMLAQMAERHPAYADQFRELGERHGRSRYDMVGAIESGDRAFVLFEPPGSDVPAEEMHWEPVPYVVVLRRTSDGWRIAGNPNPYRGMIVSMGPVPVTDPDGNRIWLHLDDPE